MHVCVITNISLHLLITVCIHSICVCNQGALYHRRNGYTKKDES